MTAPAPLPPPFVDITAGYSDYFERHRLFAAEGLPTIGSSPVKMTPSERLLLWTLAFALRPAVYLEIGSRDDADRVTYPDVDLLWNSPTNPDRYSRRDGTPY